MNNPVLNHPEQIYDDGRFIVSLLYESLLYQLF